MRVVFWGTYDTGKPRNRILLRGLRENKIDLIECHQEIWSGVEDKSQIKSPWQKVLFFIRWFCTYPSLVYQYLRLPPHDIVVVGYLGQLDVLVLWPFAKIRRVPIVWDAFISLHDTVVKDRKMFPSKHPASLLLYLWEWLSCRAADLILLDTKAHVDYFVEQFKINPEKMGVVFVGAEPECFSAAGNDLAEPSTGDNFSVLFYGQFIPLHGIETIIQAASLIKKKSCRWIIIGQGQEEQKIKKLILELAPENLEWIPWVDYDKLIGWIRQVDLCLGIFGTSDKAARVIPNKVYQILCAGKPLVTRDSPAIRELLNPEMDGVDLIKPGDAKALAALIEQLATTQATDAPQVYHQQVHEKIQPLAIGRQLLDIIETKFPCT